MHIRDFGISVRIVDYVRMFYYAKYAGESSRHAVYQCKIGVIALLFIWSVMSFLK